MGALGLYRAKSPPTGSHWVTAMSSKTRVIEDPHGGGDPMGERVPDPEGRPQNGLSVGVTHGVSLRWVSPTVKPWGGRAIGAPVDTKLLSLLFFSTSF